MSCRWKGCASPGTGARGYCLLHEAEVERRMQEWYAANPLLAKMLIAGTSLLRLK